MKSESECSPIPVPNPNPRSPSPPYRLLEAGHTVHTTVRDPNRAPLVEPLKQIPGADTRLKIFKADLMSPGSFDEAVKGCDVVIHVASPLIMAVKPHEVEAKLLNPAIQGTENVLTSVNKTECVKRVVLTASMASVVAAIKEHGDKVLDETTWSIKCSKTDLPYYFSKREAEKKAWEMQKAQSRWTLSTIHPGIVVGPPLIKREDSESIKLYADAMNGKMWPAVPAFVVPASALKDVVAAHCLAAVAPNSQGRYLIAKNVTLRALVYEYLKDDFGAKYSLPSRIAPIFFVRMFGPLLGLSRDQVAASYSTSEPPKVDVSKAERDLGLTLSDLKTAAVEMVHKLMDFGLVPRK